MGKQIKKISNLSRERLSFNVFAIKALETDRQHDMG